LTLIRSGDSFIFRHSIPENPVICRETKVSPTTPSFINWLTLIRSGDSFIFRHSIPENPVITYAIRSGDSFIFRQHILSVFL
jgi:hypothetical protein